MKKLILVTVVVVLSYGPTFALTPMGPPVATLEKGQTTVGVGYSYSETDIELEYQGSKIGVDYVDLHTTLANIHYGIVEDRWEVYAALGLAEIRDGGFSGGWDFAGGIGTKITTNLDRILSWGVLCQAFWFQGEDDWTVAGYSGDTDIDAYEIQIAAGPSYKADTFCVYGGPFVHVMRGHADLKQAGSTVSFDIEEDGVVGGYIGGNVQVAENVTANIEFQVTQDAVGFGLGMSYGF